MNSRQRFQQAINHQQPDRVPIDVGSDLHNGIHEVAYGRLLDHLGEHDEYPPLRSDAAPRRGQGEHSRPPACRHALHFRQRSRGFQLKFEADGSWADEWGVRRKPCGYYDEACHHPLAGCDLADAKAFRLSESARHNPL